MEMSEAAFYAAFSQSPTHTHLCHITHSPLPFPMLTSATTSIPMLTSPRGLHMGLIGTGKLNPASSGRKPRKIGQSNLPSFMHQRVAICPFCRLGKLQRIVGPYWCSQLAEWLAGHRILHVECESDLNFIMTACDLGTRPRSIS